MSDRAEFIQQLSNVLSGALASFHPKLDELARQQRIIMSQLDDLNARFAGLTQEVARQTTIKDGVLALLRDVRAQVGAIVTAPDLSSAIAAADAILAGLTRNSQALADAVAAGTTQPGPAAQPASPPPPAA